MTNPKTPDVPPRAKHTPTALQVLKRQQRRLDKELRNNIAEIADATTGAFAAVSEPRKRAYLAAYVLSAGNVSRAIKLAGISHYLPYTDNWRNDAEYQRLFEKIAKPLAAHHLEAEAVRRAHEGVLEPVGWYKGEPGGYIRRYSDVLLIFLLKGAFPDKYKDRTEIRGALATLDYGKLPDDALARIAGGEHSAVVLASLAREVPAGLLRGADPADVVESGPDNGETGVAE